MKLKDFNTEEHFKQSFKKVFGEDIDISLDTTFGELAEMQNTLRKQGIRNHCKETHIKKMSEFGLKVD